MPRPNPYSFHLGRVYELYPIVERTVLYFCTSLKKYPQCTYGESVGRSLMTVILLVGGCAIDPGSDLAVTDYLIY